MSLFKKNSKNYLLLTEWEKKNWKWTELNITNPKQWVTDYIS